VSPLPRRDILRLILVGGAAILAMGCGPKRDRRPNIVVIMSDDHRHDAMGCAGDARLETPSLDRLAAGGVRFTNAFVTTSLCSPSRASFLTGTYAHTHGVYYNEMRDPYLTVPLFPELLQQAGYETAFIGKWHMLRRATPRRGFDYWLSFNGQGEYFRNTWNENGEWSRTETYVTDELTDRALAWLARPHAKPFLLILSHKAVHAPLVPAPRHLGRYANTDFQSLDDPHDQLNLKPDWGGRGAMADPLAEIRNYNRCVLALDESVGKILDELHRQNIEDDTVVIYASDNGALFGEHGGLWDKRAAYEPSLRIPLLMRYPRRVEAGVTCDETVLNLDLAPTLLELAGVAVPPSVQGVSWMPLLEGRPGREAFLYEYFRELGTVPTCLAVRTREWKYVTYPDDPQFGPELYDLRADPGELVNLAADPAHAAKVRELAERIAVLKRDTRFQPPPRPRG
jgi:N-acetylglucosamine-6-sulfatase